MSNTIKSTLFLAACTLIITACGDNKKKDSFTRVITPGAGTAGRAQTPAKDDGTLNEDDSSKDSKAADETKDDIDPIKDALAAKCHVLTADGINLAKKLEVDVEGQTFCNTLKVKIDDDKKIIWNGQGLHGQEVLEAYSIKSGEYHEDPSNEKKIIATYESKYKSANGKKAQLLRLGYILPHKLSQIDQDDSNKVVVKVNGAELTAEQFEVVESIKGDADSKAKIQIKDAQLFENIEFEIEFNYSLK